MYKKFTILSFLLYYTFTLYAQVPVSINNTCDNNWLKMPNALSGVTVGDLDITGNKVTIEALCNATGDTTRALVSKHKDPRDVNYFLCPDLAQITTADGFFSVTSPCPYVNNKTYHVALVYDGASLKLYRNGFLMGETPATGNLITNDWPTTIGEYSYSLYNGLGSISNIFKGYINEVRIWNVARTQTELQANMSGSLPSPSTQTGLLAYYVFDNLLNKQGNIAFDGTLNAAASINNTNTACNFTADSCVTTTDIACNTWLNTPAKLTGISIGQLHVTGNQMTIEAMCNASDIYDLSRALVSKHGWSANCNYFLCPDLAQITTSNGFFSATSPCGFVSNKTYHVAMVYNGSTLRLYRNGFLMQEVQATGNLVNNSWPATIGEYAYAMYFNNASISNIFKGYINEVRIWNVARTQQQIQDYMNTQLPNPSTQAGLMAYYNFDNLQNKQGNTAFNGTLRGAATINNTNPNCGLLADSCAIVLPVTFTGLQVFATQQNNIRLTWHTEQETGIAQYVVERSLSADEGFISAGTVNARNSGVSGTYSFTDVKALANTRYYYRIRIVERDGSYKYSDVRTAIIKTLTFSANVYPTLAQNNITIQTANATEPAVVRIYNNLGQLALQQKIPSQINTTVNINVTHLAKGSYWVQVMAGNEKCVKKIEKL
jgi:hypothetical protein